VYSVESKFHQFIAHNLYLPILNVGKFPWRVLMSKDFQVFFCFLESFRRRSWSGLFSFWIFSACKIACLSANGLRLDLLWLIATRRCSNHNNESNAESPYGHLYAGYPYADVACQFSIVQEPSRAYHNSYEGDRAVFVENYINDLW